MFFKRVAKNAAPKPALGSVQTIPEIFYGGSDPEAGLHGTGVNKMIKPSSVVSSSGGASSSGKTRLVAVVMIIIFLVFSAGAAWLYWNYLGGGSGPTTPVPARDNQTQNQMVNNSPITEPVFSETATSTPSTTSTDTFLPTSTSSFIPTTSTAPSLIELSVAFPVINQLNAPDFDSDTLTDLEEEIFGTDQSIFDSDADGYSDGQELINLYNPKGAVPVRLAESGLVREFTHPLDVYRLYYPISWQAGSVDAGSNTMLFTAANGDYVEVRVFAKSNGESFSVWFGRVAKDQQISDLQSVSNNFKTIYLKRKDGLVLYVDQPAQVIAVIYHPLVNTPINFRTTLQMIVESLRVGQ